MTTGEKIRELREKYNLTQEELGKLCDTTKQTIQKYENGTVTNIPLDRCELLAKHLHVTPEFLVGWKEQPSPTLQNINGILQKLNPDQLAQAEAFLLFLEQSGK